LSSPGAYRPDATEGIDNIHDLPTPHRRKQQRNRQFAHCPHCQKRSPRSTNLEHRKSQKVLHYFAAKPAGKPAANGGKETRKAVAATYPVPVRGNPDKHSRFKPRV